MNSFTALKNRIASFFRRLTGRGSAPFVSRKIVVIGASRGIGRATVREALRRGHRVVAIARTMPKRPRNARLSWFTGDARDTNILEQALRDADAIVITLGADAPSKPTTLFSESAAATVAAMKQAGITRLIQITGIGAGDSRGHGGFVYDKLLFPAMLAKSYQDKDIAERIVAASGLDWTIIRPGFLTNARGTNRIRALTTPDEYRPGKISRASVARFILDRAEHGGFTGQTPLLINK